MFKMGYVKEFKRLFGFMRGQSVPYWVGLIFTAAITSVSGVVVAFVSRDMLDAAQTGDMNLLLRGGLLMLGCLVLVGLISPIFSILLNVSVDRATSNTYLWVYRKLMRLPMRYYEKQHSGDIINRVSFDVRDATRAFSGYFLELVTTLFGGIFSIAALFVLDFRFGIIVCAIGMISLFLNKRFAPRFRTLNTAKNNAQRDWGVKLVDVLAGISTIRLFRLREAMSHDYREQSQASAQAVINRSKAHAALAATDNAMGGLSMTLVIIVGSYFVLQEMTTFGTIIAVTQLMNGVHLMFTQVGGFVALTQRSLASAERLFEVCDVPEEPEINTARDFALNMPAAVASHAMISIRNAHFRYQPEEPAVEGIDLDVPQGATVALVGPSGGGKSTLIKLLLGLYPLDSGEIIIGNKSMNRIEIAALRDQLAYVPQESYLFAGSIYDNICYGAPNATKEDVEKAAKLANAYEFILEQPQGFNTHVGERCIRLSGGQRQRIAIARAFIKNAPILLLDEATASLDSQNEKAVQEAINRLMEGRTVLVVAHRLSTIMDADMIVVVSDGKIAEMGRHDELFDKGGIYRELFMAISN